VKFCISPYTDRVKLYRARLVTPEYKKVHTEPRLRAESVPYEPLSVTVSGSRLDTSAPASNCIERTIEAPTIQMVYKTAPTPARLLTAVPF